MKEILLLTIIYVSTSLFIPAYASINDDNRTTPHIDGNSQFPPTKWQVVRHTIRLHVPKNSKAVSQLLINIPDNITLSHDINNIQVFNENEQIISSNVSVNAAA